MIILIITESEKQVVSGIPESVTVESSSPSTIFYTLDGTEPNQTSDMYVNVIYLTYSEPKVTLKLKAVGVSEESEIFEITWGVKTPDYNKASLVGKEGINILPSGGVPINSLAINETGDLARESVIDFQDLDIKSNTSDRIGQPIPGGSTIPFIKFPKMIKDKKEKISSPNMDDFDPTAQVIVVDGYAGFDKQKVRLINRPHGTMRPTSKFYESSSHRNNHISGDFSRYMYNPKTKKLVSYYRESLDGRWLISTQKVEALKLNITPISGRNRFVFRWIMDRCQTKLF